MEIRSLKQDAIASIVVFLVAIPLCLGIALASGAPLYSGIIAGIIGGVIVGALSDSQVSVSGPAAGMIAVVLAAIATLGSFHAFLLALVFAGFIQVIVGAFRAGFLADYIPSTVIQGLLTAIGVLIIIKQLPIAFGLSGHSALIMNAVKTAQEDFAIGPLLHLVHHISISTSVISLLSIFIMVCWPKLKNKILKQVPAAIIVVLAAVLINTVLQHSFPGLALPSSHLVNIPVNENILSLFSQLPHPQFADWLNPSVYVYAVIIAVVASLETLLCLEAAEKMDPQHRFASRNKELVAQGIGNSLSGLLGGLPITSVIVRTTVNIHSNNASKLSTIFHGMFLLLSLLFIPNWLNLIPLPALAAILIVIGYKLAQVAVFKKMYRQGQAYFAAFITTVVAIVFTNLLTGILIGLAVSLFFILQVNSRHQFLRVKEKHTSGDVLRIVLPQQLTFLNKPTMVTALESIPANSRVIIDAKNTEYIDQDLIEVMKTFSEEKAINKGISMNFLGLQDHYSIATHSNFITATTLDVQSSLSATDVLQVLKEGNQRFINNTLIHKDFKRQIHDTAKSQHPVAVILSCIDSRVPVENVFDLNLGDVFVARIAGNIINPDILASIEFACEIAGARLIVVLGHRRCGAVNAACENVELGHLSQLLAKIKPAIALEKETNDLIIKETLEHTDRVACVNVELVQQQLTKESEILHKLLADQRIGIVGGMYDVSSGQVAFNKMRHDFDDRVDIQAFGQPAIET